MEVMFFPAKKPGTKYLGGGYLKTGGVSVRYQVWKSDKKENGFVMSLPSHKDDQGNFQDDVEFLNKEAREQAELLLQEKMGSVPSSSYSQQTSQRTAAAAPSAVDISKKASGMKAPF